MHHTKHKGDIALIRISSDLIEKEYNIFYTISEHLPFDIIAYKNSLFYRVQVKYVTMVDGCIDVSLISTYNISSGMKKNNLVNTNEIDYVAVYCPDNKNCYYVPINKVNSGGHIKLRIDPPKNNQKIGINWANDYLEAP